MGLFSSVRARRTKPAPAESHNGREPTPAMHRPQPPAGPPNPRGKSLRDSLHQLYTIRPSRQTFAEEAIKLIAQGAGTKTAALLVYEARHNRAKLLASVGLERDAIEVLSGDLGHGSWDIPVRSLRNRRINVIESAHENPFVPKPIIAINPRRLTIAALPFYHANAPVGVIVLFSPTHRGFADGLLHTLSQAARVCALALAELPSAGVLDAVKGVDDGESSTEQPNLLRGLAALKSELSRLTHALEETERQRASEVAERVSAQSFLQKANERNEELKQEIEALCRQRETIPELQGQIEHLNERLHEAVQMTEQERNQIVHLRSDLEQARGKIEEDTNALRSLSEARDQLKGELEAAQATAKNRDEKINALRREVEELTEQTKVLGDVQGRAAAAETARQSLEEDLAKVREQIAAAQREIAEKNENLERSSASLDQTRAEAENLGRQLADARGRIEQLERESQQLESATEQLESVSAERASLLQEVVALRDQLSISENEAAAAAEASAARIAKLEREQAQLQQELAAASQESGQTVSQLRSQIEASASDRQQLAEKIEALAHVEGERRRLLARVEDVEQELLAAQEANRALEARTAELSQASSRLIAERQELQARVEKLSSSGRKSDQQKQADIDAAQKRLAEAQAEITNLRATMEANRSASAEEIERTRQTAERALEEVRKDLTNALDEKKTLEEWLAQAEERAAEQTRTTEAVRGECDSLHESIEALTAERAALSGRVDTVNADLEALRQERANAAERIAALEKQLEDTRQELLADAASRIAETERTHQAAEAGLREGHAAEVSALQQQIEELRAEFEEQLNSLVEEHEQLSRLLEEKDRLLQSAERGLTAIDLGEAEDEEEESILGIDRSHAPQHDSDDEEEDLDEEAVVDEVFLLDQGAIGNDAARQLIEFGHRVTAIAPEPGSIPQLKERPACCAAINLAIPTSWETLRSMRNGSGVPKMPLLAYALAEDAPKGFWLGPVDFIPLPVEKNDLRQLLSSMVPKIKRVLAMSNDIDVMGDVRNALADSGISTAVVLDGRQALDLLPTVRPEAAILHLSPSCTDVFRTIAGLRNAEHSRDIPILFLMDSEVQPREEAFLSGGIRMLSGRGNLVPDGLVDTLASALELYRPDPLDDAAGSSPPETHGRASAARDS